MSRMVRSYPSKKAPDLVDALILHPVMHKSVPALVESALMLGGRDAGREGPRQGARDGA